jgi:hypothetical protein
MDVPESPRSITCRPSYFDLNFSVVSDQALLEKAKKENNAIIIYFILTSQNSPNSKSIKKHFINIQIRKNFNTLLRKPSKK